MKSGEKTLKNIMLLIDARAERHGLYSAASLLCAVTILVFSTIPVAAGGMNSGIRAHCAAYGLLAMVLGLYCKTLPPRHPFLVAAGAAFLWGAAVECLQYFIPYREFQLQDLLLNACGALFGVVPGYVMLQCGWIAGRAVRRESHVC